MVNMRVIKAKNAIMTLVIIAFLIMLIIKIFLFGKVKIKDLSLIPVIQDTIIATSGNSLKEFKSIDRDNTEQLLSSELQMSKYIKTDETERLGTENTIQFLFYDYISYYRNGYKSCYRLVISRQLWLRIGRLLRYKCRESPLNNNLSL